MHWPSWKIFPAGHFFMHGCPCAPLLDWPIRAGSKTSLVDTYRCGELSAAEVTIWCCRRACSLAKRVRVRDAILESLVLILLVWMRYSPLAFLQPPARCAVALKVTSEMFPKAGRSRVLAGFGYAIAAASFVIRDRWIVPQSPLE